MPGTPLENEFPARIYINELVHYKPLKFQTKTRAAAKQATARGAGLKVFPAAKSEQQEKQPASLLDRYVQQLEYRGQRIISIQGLRYVCSPQLRRWVRFSWALVLLCAITGCVVMYLPLARRHHAQQLKTVVSTTQHPIYSIEFPAVAVCPTEKVNWLRALEAEKRFLPAQSRAELRAAFQYLLLILERLDFRQFETLTKIKLQFALLQQLGDINLTALSKFLAFRCEELFVSCTFDGTHYDCCKLFVAEHTERGICLVFNSLISEESKKKRLSDNFYPWKLGKASEGLGLKFTLRYNSSYYRSANKAKFTVNLMIKEAEEWSESRTHPLYRNTINFISILPRMTITLKNTRSLSPAKRGCLFTEENTYRYGRAKGLPYSRQNCHALCLQRHLFLVCNCTLPLFFPPTTTSESRRECVPSDLICMYENRDIFSYIKTTSQDQYIKDERRGLTCDCVQNCVSVFYLLSLNSRKISDQSLQAPIIKADIHYAQRVMTKYEAQLDYTQTDLWAHFGGILGLFVGASALSVAELLFVMFKLLFMLIEDRHIIWKSIKSCCMLPRVRRVGFRK